MYVYLGKGEMWMGRGKEIWRDVAGQWSSG